MVLVYLTVVGLLVVQDFLLWLRGRYRFIDHAENPDKEEWPQVSILVPARNEEAHLPACLQSLGRLDYPEDRLQFIIGNDQSSDKTAYIIKEWINLRDNGILVDIDASASKKVNGKAHALEQMARSAGGDLLLFTDADCTVNPDWVKEMVRAYRPAFGLVTGITAVSGGSIFSSMQSIDWWITLGMVKVLSDLGRSVTAMGNNMLVGKEAYIRVGGFANVPFSVTEDLALAKALTSMGYRPVQQMTPGSLVRTKSERNFNELLRQRKRWMGGAMSLPWHWILLLALQVGFFPVMIGLLFENMGLGLVLWCVKIVVQSLFVKEMVSRAGIAVPAFHLLLFEFYYMMVSWCTIVYYFWPSPINWKERQYQ